MLTTMLGRRVPLVALSLMLAAPSPGRVQRETVRIAGPLPGLRLALHHVSAGSASGRPVVLLLHGSAVSVSGNFDYPFGGTSFMEILATDGLDVWALDQYGYGESDRYPAMSEPATAHPPLGGVTESVDQVDSAAAYLVRHTGVGRIMLIGNSGGSLVAGLFAATRPALVSRLILFAPITPLSADRPTPPTIPAYVVNDPRDLWSYFAQTSAEAGAPAVLDSTIYSDWAAAYLRSDPTSRTRSPASVKVPNGPAGDIAAVTAGRFPFDPAAIQASTLILMGETDDVATWPGVQWLLASLRNAPHRRLVVIGHASHVIQIESERRQAFTAMADFLKESD